MSFNIQRGCFLEGTEPGEYHAIGEMHPGIGVVQGLQEGEGSSQGREGEDPIATGTTRLESNAEGGERAKSL